jgi:metal-responsive CopG/Arc/MetJ family transcriptional regulator
LIARSNSSTAFRLPQGLLATVDIICDKQDLTRSQVFRRSITEYLKNQQVEVLPEPEPKLTWSEALYRRNR